MASITDLTNALADAMGTLRAPVATTARHLREAGLLPTGDMGRYGAAPVSAEHAAALLLGFLGTDLPCKAPKAVQVFGTLPAISATFQRANAGRIVRTGSQIEDVPIGRGEGPGRTVLTRTLHGALAGIIGAAASGVASACVPTELGLVRDLAVPLGWLRFPVVAPGQDLIEAEIFYGSSNGADISETFWSSTFRISASVDGAVLQRLGKVLFEDAKMRVLADLKDAEVGVASDEERAHAPTL